MTYTGRTAPAPQHLQALERANEVRLARAELKRRIARGDVTAADVILEAPHEVSSMTIGDLLTSQRRWGTTRSRRVLSAVPLAENKAIGSMTEKRHPFIPDVPTFIELGYKEFVMGNWTGIVAPTGMPKTAVNKMAAAVTRILREPEMSKRLVDMGVDPLGGTPEEFGKLIRAETARFGKAVKASGAKAD